MSAGCEKRKRLDVSLNESSEDSVAVRFEQLDLDEGAVTAAAATASEPTAVETKPLRPAPKRSHVAAAAAAAASTSDGDEDRDEAPLASVDVRDLELGFDQISLAKNAAVRRPFHMPYIT